MSRPIVERPQPRRRLIAALALLAFPLIIAGAVVLILTGGGGIIASPADLIGEPVRAKVAAGDRVFLLTSQWKTYGRTYGGRNRSVYTDLLVDVWAFDAPNAKPVWRRRLAQVRSGLNRDRLLLGVQAGVLWIVEPEGLKGLSVVDGAVAADVAAIEAANPGLKGLLPTEARYYRFDASGLHFTAADGRPWRMTGKGLEAAPVTAGATFTASPDVAVLADIAGGTGTYAFQERGLDLGKRWLGLLADEEVATFRTNGGVGGVDPANHPRMRLWSAHIRQQSTFLGPRPVYADFAPLPEGPEFINSGLLSGGGIHDLPIFAFKPDSVLVLHYDRLGDQAQMKLSRVAGPAGKVLWTANLPIQALEAVMPGEGTVVLFGRRAEDFPKRSLNDAGSISVNQLIAVDLASGRMGIYGFKVKATKPEDIPPSSTAATPPG